VGKFTAQQEVPELCICAWVTMKERECGYIFVDIPESNCFTMLSAFYAKIFNWVFAYVRFYDSKCFTKSENWISLKYKNV
jgi:hypothetical protein